MNLTVTQQVTSLTYLLKEINVAMEQYTCCRCSRFVEYTYPDKKTDDIIEMVMAEHAESKTLKTDPCVPRLYACALNTIPTCFPGCERCYIRKGGGCLSCGICLSCIGLCVCCAGDVATGAILVFVPISVLGIYVFFLNIETIVGKKKVSYDFNIKKTFEALRMSNRAIQRAVIKPMTQPVKTKLLMRATKFHLLGRLENGLHAMSKDSLVEALNESGIGDLDEEKRMKAQLLDITYSRDEDTGDDLVKKHADADDNFQTNRMFKVDQITKKISKFKISHCLAKIVIDHMKSDKEVYSKGRDTRYVSKTSDDAPNMGNEQDSFGLETHRENFKTEDQLKAFIKKNFENIGGVCAETGEKKGVYVVPDEIFPSKLIEVDKLIRRDFSVVDRSARIKEFRSANAKGPTDDLTDVFGAKYVISDRSFLTMIGKAHEMLAEVYELENIEAIKFKTTMRKGSSYAEVKFVLKIANLRGDVYEYGYAEIQLQYVESMLSDYVAEGHLQQKLKGMSKDKV